MDSFSSGEDLVIKARKPYTITKQRERWTEEEHNKFLEAIKLYGRAWQRIEEHIGTKTAVQIRSHAQKFFTKLEKEATVRHALDIEIPPPRPKRKLFNPYPRKTSVGAPAPQVGLKNGNILNPGSSLGQSTITLALEKEPEEPCNDGKLGNSNEYQKKNNCSEVSTLIKTAPCSPPSPADAPKRSCSFKQYVPLPKEATNIEAKGMQADCIQPFQDNGPLNVTNAYLSHEKSVHNRRTHEFQYVDKLSTDDVHASPNYPHRVPVHILDMSAHPNTDCKFHQMSRVEKTFSNPAASAATSAHYSNASRSTIHHSFSSYHHPPVSCPAQNQDDYQAFLHLFSSLIVSTLAQNPVSYAAAGFAAANLWPCVNTESAPLEQHPASSMALIAAATVAAATSWWAAHGLLPLFSCPVYCSPSMNSGRRENIPDGQQFVPECSEAFHQQHSVLKSSVLSSTSESEDAKVNVVGLDETTKVADAVEFHDANKSKNKKLADRSSCGSNPPSSSEVEAEKEEHHGIDNEEPEQLDAIHPLIDPFSRRFRSTPSNVNDSWKEVSEEGRLAFQALFSREVLPQSFSPTHSDVKNKDKKVSIKDSTKEKDNGLQLDLNGKTWVIACPQKQEVENNASSIGENKEEGLNMGLGHVKLKARRTGFRPYKRCSTEAEASRVSPNSQDREKDPKRLRLEGEAST